MSFVSLLVRYVVRIYAHVGLFTADLGK